MDEPDIPSTARMIDLWLGGSHHYPVDVAAAGAFERAYGPVAHEFRALRAFLGRVVRRMAAAGIEEYVVVGAGVPAQGNVHEVVPGARVLYVDLDEANVALGRGIVAELPGVAYTFGDAADLTGTVDPAVLADTLPGLGERPTGVVVLGLAAFLEDEQLAGLFARLHAATAPGSMLAFDFDTEVLREHPEALALMGPAFRMRAPEAFPALLGPWRLTAEGARPVARWGAPAGATAVTDGVENPAFHGGLATHSG